MASSVSPITGKPFVAPALAPETLVRMHELMVRTRLLEERLITMQKQGDGYFWIKAKFAIRSKSHG